MKVYRAGALALAVAALAACSWPFGDSSATTSSNASGERSIQIYQGETLQATYTIDDDGAILQSKSIGDFDVWTTRSYDYDSDGDIRSITESYAGSDYTNTKSFSTSRSLSRSGKVLSKSYAITEDSTVPSRAMRSTERVYSYAYDDDDALVSIVKEDQDSNVETKYVARFVETSESDLTDDLDEEGTATSRSAESVISGSSIDIASDIQDFRPTGIHETFNRSGEDISTTIDKLTVGTIFIDEGGTARKVTSVTASGKTIIYGTTTPDFKDFLNYVSLPRYTYDWDDFEVRPELMPEGLELSSSDDADDRWSLSASTSLTYTTDVYYEGKKNGKLALSLEPSVAMTFDYGLSWGYPRVFRSWKKGWGVAKFTQKTSISGSVTYYQQGEWEKDIALYPKSLGTDSASIAVGLYMVPKFTGTLSLSLSLAHEYENQTGISWVMGKWWVPQNFSAIKSNAPSSSYAWSFGAKAEGSATYKMIAVGGKATLFGVSLFKSLPGLGPYFEVSGSVTASEKVENGKTTDESKAFSGSLQLGLFMEASVELWNDKWEWKILELKNPWLSLGDD